MQLYQLNVKEFQSLTFSGDRDFILVESQVYGQPEDMLYNIVCSNRLGEYLRTTDVGRKIEDTGRTVGFWQNLGATGVLGTQSASTLNFSESLVNIIRRCPEAEINFDAPTWAEILEKMPLSDAIKSMIDFTTPEVSTTRRKKSKKSNKK